MNMVSMKYKDSKRFAIFDFLDLLDIFSKRR